MGNINNGRIIKALDSKSDSDLIELRQAIDERLAQRGKLALVNADYEAGRRAGEERTLNIIRTIYWPLTAAIDKVNEAMTFIYGLVAGGYGEQVRIQVQQAAVILGARLAHLAIEQEKFTVRSGNPYAADFSPAYILFDEAKHFVSGLNNGDPLRELLVSRSTLAKPILAERGLLGPGVKKDRVIDELCARAKAYKDRFMTDEETLNQLMLDLENPTNDLERAQLKRLDGWGANAFRLAYRTRYPK